MEGPKMKSTSFTITADRRDKITDAIKKAMKAALGHERVSELVPLDHRYSNRKGDAEKKIAGWTGYERYCDLKSGHTVYVGLSDPSDPKATVSAKPDKYAQGKAEKKMKRLADREARKAQKIVKVRQPKELNKRLAEMGDAAPVPTKKTKGWMPEESAIVTLMKSEQMGRASATKKLQQQHAIAKADAHVTPLAQVG